MYGLAGLFCFAVAAINLSWHGTFLNSIPSAVGIPLALLLVGSFAIKRTSRWHENIDRQLSRFASSGGKTVQELRPLPATDALANGWNQLLARVHEHSAWNGVERRLSEAVHSQQARRWETVFQNLSDGIVICDPEGLIIQHNRAFAVQVTGSDSESMVGANLMQSLERLGENVTEKLCGLTANHTNQVIEVQRTDDITQGVWRLSRTLLESDANGSSDSIWTLRDITQHKLVENAREQFVCTATHELRTPLANIRAYTETLALATDIPIEQQQAFYNTINSEATRLARFVDELLNISQMEAGAITIRKHDVQLERLLEEILDSQRPLALEKNQTFEFSVPPKLPKILADKDKLNAALTNLLGNAIKYTPEGGKVSMRVDAEAHRILFIVEDSGFGISQEELPKLCSKFFRSSDSRVQSLVGSGLGLAFTQEVARLHGGRVTIQSQLNQGSCFTLELPLH
jgi:PAS domain S-box-containing protein